MTDSIPSLPLLNALSPEFERRLQRSITQRGQVLLLVRYSRSAGVKRYVLASDSGWVAETAARLPEETEIVVVESVEVVAGGSSAELSLSELRAEPATGEWLVLTEPSANVLLEGFIADDRDTLVEELARLGETEVLIVTMPDWWSDDKDDVWSGFIPTHEGVVRRGLY